MLIFQHHEYVRLSTTRKTGKSRKPLAARRAGIGFYTTLLAFASTGYVTQHYFAVLALII